MAIKGRRVSEDQLSSGGRKKDSQRATTMSRQKTIKTKKRRKK
jgi:hypothetical protein